MKKKKPYDPKIPAALRRELAKQGKELRASVKEELKWIKKRLDRIEHNTSPHVLAGYEDWI